MTDKFSLYEERGELLDCKVIADMNERPFCLQPQLEEMNEQIRLMENITFSNQNDYFGKSVSVFETLDGRNEIENAQIVAAFGRSNVTTSAEWRKRHLVQTQEQIDEAKANAEVLKGLRS